MNSNPTDFAGVARLIRVVDATETGATIWLGLTYDEIDQFRAAYPEKKTLPYYDPFRVRASDDLDVPPVYDSAGWLKVIGKRPEHTHIVVQVDEIEPFKGMEGETFYIEAVARSQP